MKNIYYSPQLQRFAQNPYGENPYGAGTYSSAETSTGTPPQSGPGTTPDLAETGVGFVFIATVAATLIFIALVVRVWRRKPAKPAQSVVTPEDDSKTDQQN